MQKRKDIRGPRLIRGDLKMNLKKSKPIRANDEQ